MRKFDTVKMGNFWKWEFFWKKDHWEISMVNTWARLGSLLPWMSYGRRQRRRGWWCCWWKRKNEKLPLQGRLGKKPCRMQEEWYIGLKDCKSPLSNCFGSKSNYIAATIRTWALWPTKSNASARTEVYANWLRICFPYTQYIQDDKS